MLSLLARLGSTADDDPALLLLRSTAARDIGQVDQAAAQIDQAVAHPSVGAPPPSCATGSRSRPPGPALNRRQHGGHGEHRRSPP